MGLDVNKIIMESIQEVADIPVEKDSKKDEKTETAPVTESEETYEPIDVLSAAIAPALSAGLGALALRNRLRSVQQ